MKLRKIRTGELDVRVQLQDALVQVLDVGEVLHRVYCDVVVVELWRVVVVFPDRQDCFQDVGESGPQVGVGHSGWFILMVKKL